LFDKVLATNPSDPKIMTDKGKALDDLGMHKGTIQYYDKALAIKPALQDAIDGKCSWFFLAYTIKHGDLLTMISPVCISLNA
jgi:tetratricopeptide (TPR) repeat protein